MTCPHCKAPARSYRAARACFFRHVQSLPDDLRLLVHFGELTLAEAELEAAA